MKLLVLLDGSEVSDHILPAVTGLAQPQMALRLLTVSDDSKVAQAMLDQRANQLGGQGQIDTVVQEGNVVPAILEEVRSYKPTLVCASSHGRSGVARLVLGSVTSELIHRCEVPLFLAGPEFDVKGDIWKAKRVLVPVDGSPLSEQAVPLAVTISRWLKVPVKIIQVITKGDMPKDGSDAFESNYVAWLAKKGSWAAGIGWDVYHGHPADSILEDSREEWGTLIVMTTRGRSGMGRALGSVADSVLRHARGPLVVLHPQNI